MKWNRIKLRDVCEVITKGTTPTSLGMSFSESGIPFLRVRNLQRGTVILNNDVLHIDEQTDRALSRSRIQAGDILLSIAGTIGRSAIVPNNAPPLNCNQAISIIRPSKSISRLYLQTWLDTKDAQRQMQGAKVTGTISNLSLTQVGNLQIPLPPLDEQHRIAAVLDKADALCEKRRQAINKLDALLQAVFLDMFGDPLKNPKGWNRATLNQITANITDGKHGDCRPRTDSGYYFISVKDIVDGRIEYTNARQIEYSDFLKAHRRTRLEVGDVLITSSGTIGRTAVIREHPNLDKTTFQKSVAIIKPREDTVNPDFLKSILDFSIRGLSIASSGSSQKNLLLSQLRAFRIYLPPIELQRNFAQRVAAIEKLKTAGRASLSEMERLFASIQQRAFNGELFSDKATADALPQKTMTTSHATCASPSPK